MTGSTRIKNSKIKFVIGGINYYADATNVVVDNEKADSDLTTFADVEAGGAVQWFVSGTSVQSTDTDSFWSMVWANSGAHVAAEFAVHGNDIASADQPTLTGTVKIGSKPKLGGDANSTYSFDWRFDFDDEPVLDRGDDATAAITSITPAGKTVGDSVLIAGTRFTGATDVKFAAVSATDFVVVSDNTIVAVIPAGTGAKAVTIVTAAGASPSVSYTVASE